MSSPLALRALLVEKITALLNAKILETDPSKIRRLDDDLQRARALREEIEQAISLLPEEPAAADDETAKYAIVGQSPRISFSQLMLRASKHNTKTLELRYRKRYHESYYLRRLEAIRHFNDFLDSDCSFFVLTGVAGTGKSSFACSLLHSLSEHNLMLLIDCAQLELDAEPEMVHLVSRILRVRSANLNESLRTLESTDIRRFLLIFDAVNEHPDREELLRKISSLINGLSSQKLKIVITCRLPIWNSLERFLAVPEDAIYHPHGSKNNVELHAFEAIEFEQAYNRYKTAFNLKTRKEELSEELKALLRQPLFLNLTARACEGRVIPASLGLRDVFSSYVYRCIGEEDGDMYSLLDKAVKLMYRQADRDIRLALLREEDESRSTSLAATDTAYSRLLEEGILSQRSADMSLLRRTPVVFVTYERVFEFLLADLVIKSPTIETVLRNLDLAQARSFFALRGALELSIGFYLISGLLEKRWILEFARIDRPDCRILIADTLRTIALSGLRKLAEDIVLQLSNDKSSSARLLAVQAAYLLRMDDGLISLSLSSDRFLRNLSALYIYESWNRARLDGRLEYGYLSIEKLFSYVDLKRPRRTLRSLAALAALCLNMGVHIVDDPDSLKPLLSLLRDLVSKVPGLRPSSERSGLIRFTSETTAKIVIELLVDVLSPLLLDKEVHKNIFTDPSAKRALLDVGSLINLDRLDTHEDLVVKLITWDDPMVLYSARSVMTRHVFLTPQWHITFLTELLDRPAMALLVRLNILHCMVFGCLARLLNGRSFKADTFESFPSQLRALWYECSERRSDTTDRVHDEELEAIEHVLFGLFLTEAVVGRRSGNITTTRILENFVVAPVFREKESLRLLLRVLLKVGYQGHPVFATFSFLAPEFVRLWSNSVEDYGVECISKLRSLFPREVDDILDENISTESIAFQVRNTGGFPDPSEIWHISYNRWIMEAMAVNVTVMKIAGLVLLEFAQASSPADYIHRLMRCLLSILFDPDRIDIAHIQYGYAHDPNWNLFEKMEIPRELCEQKTAAHDYYRRASLDVVASLGRGMLFTADEQPITAEHSKEKQ